MEADLSSKPWFLSLSESWGTPPNSGAVGLK
jgi:hypothetical protein